MTKRGLKQYYEVISAYFVLKAVHVTTQQQENISVFAARLLVRGLSNDKNPKLTTTRNKKLIKLAPSQKTPDTMSKYMNKTMVQSNSIDTDIGWGGGGAKKGSV